jgi:hypothetical protein
VHTYTGAASPAKKTSLEYLAENPAAHDWTEIGAAIGELLGRAPTPDHVHETMRTIARNHPELYRRYDLRLPAAATIGDQFGLDQHDYAGILDRRASQYLAAGVRPTYKAAVEAVLADDKWLRDGYAAVRGRREG